MKGKKILAVLLAVCMGAGMLTGCGGQTGSDSGAGDAESRTEQSESASNVNKEGFPIVKEEITLKVFGQQGPVQEEWDTMGMWKKYQEMTNIKLDFTDVLSAEGFD